MLLLSLSRALSQLIPSLHSFLSCSENFFFFSSLPPFPFVCSLTCDMDTQWKRRNVFLLYKKNSKIYIHTHITEELLLFDSIRARISLASFSCRTSNAVLSDDGLIWPCHAFVCSIVRSIVHHTVLTHTHTHIDVYSFAPARSFVRSFAACPAVAAVNHRSMVTIGVNHDLLIVDQERTSKRADFSLSLSVSLRLSFI